MGGHGPSAGVRLLQYARALHLAVTLGKLRGAIRWASGPIPASFRSMPACPPAVRGTDKGYYVTFNRDSKRVGAIRWVSGWIPVRSADDGGRDERASGRAHNARFLEGALAPERAVILW